MKISRLFIQCTTLMTLFVLSITSTALAEKPADIYNRSGELYRDGDFKQSLDLYESLIESGIENPELYYNASNAAYRSNQLGKAILYIERALTLDPSDEDALANRKFLNSIKKDQEPVSGNIISLFLSRWYETVNTNSAALLSGISFALALLCATASLYLSGTKRLLVLFVLGLFMSLSLLSGGILVQKLHSEANTVEAVIMSEEARAYSGPDEENTHIFTIHEGTKVIIERNQDEWSLIRLQSGAGGWILSNHLNKI